MPETVLHTLQQLGLASLLAAAPEAHGAAEAVLKPGANAALLVPALSALSAVLCAVCAAMGVRSKLPAWITVASLAAGFVAVAFLYATLGATQQRIAFGFEWIRFSWGDGPGQTLVGAFSLYIDSLTLLWMLFVTGLGALIALYSSEYMEADRGPGYCRFFAYFSLFVLSMSCLVMADNLLLLFLGWEGVGLCSYLLIGYFYTKPAAVAAAKKAFVMNRIGDLGLLIGIALTFTTFGTVEYARLFELLRAGVDGAGAPLAGSWQATWIPIFFTVGAFGKSAQLFFYTWLPDAMEGPTPVSALIHAATMVTAGVFLVARLFPLFLADEDKTALTIIAWSGAITAFWAATIEMAIFDIKRVMGYSTISQLGYMFAGLGLLTTTGAAFHVFTHAFFKATLFLCAGAVMHGFGGQLDLRKLSGVMWMKGFRIVGIVMLIGSINLAGVPFTAGYFSKDMILAQAFSTPGEMIAGAQWIGWLLLLTAGMTAYYTFRTFFRVFLGPKQFEPGEDAHGGHGHDDHGGHDGHAHGHGHDAHGAVAQRRLQARQDFDPTTEEFDPHPPGLAMNLVLIVCAALTIGVAGLYFVQKDMHGWAGMMVHHSTAAFDAPGSHGEPTGSFLGLDPHKAMYFVSAGVGAIGVLIAYLLHLRGRTSAATANADRLIPYLGPIVNWARNKWYVDEAYDWLIVKPLWVVSNVFHLIDKLIVDGVVNGVGHLPKAIAGAVRPSQSGFLQSYAAGMAGGLVFLLLVVWALT